MRVEKEQLNIIINTLKSQINDAVIYLFGSRVDDSKRGGDIDIFLVTNQNIVLKDKIRLLAELETSGIKRKVDLIIKTPHQSQDLLFKEVLEKGIRIC